MTENARCPNCGAELHDATDTMLFVHIALECPGGPTPAGGED